MEHKMISIADQVFDELEREILSGVYERGEVLTEIKLSDRMGVSRTPIREALRRLEQERLIESTSKGVKVIGIQLPDIEDICEIRMRLEGLAARWVAERASDEDLKELQSAVELQEFYTQKGDSESLKNTDSRFHQIIYALCGSPTMRDTLEPLHRKLLKYRKASFSFPERAQQSLREHQDILTAIQNRNGKEAEELTILHIKNAKESIMKRGN
ncbi:MAG: GntR family transcriptional regulator [Clostridiales bacterium]|nr:GntR family transcriptional regulator [Clostridiales bacterium]